MGNSYTEAQALQIVNNPAVGYLRAYGSSGSYRKTVFTNSFSFAAAPEQVTTAFDDTGDVYDAIATETAEMSFDTGLIFDLDFLELISGGLMTKSTVTGGATAVNNQVIAADWTDKDPMPIALVDAAGGQYLKADGEPAITSVTGATAGVLAANDDYTIVTDVNSISGYSIVLNTAGSAGLVTSEEVTIVFDTPDVAAQTILDNGGIKNYDPVEGYILTQNRNGDSIRIDFYKAFWNANFSPAFGAENSPEAAVSNFVFSIKLDTTKEVGAQLYRITVG
jgi:hypothetical protein